MATIPSEDIPRWLKISAIAWPVAVALCTAGIAMARSDGRLESTTDRVQVLEQEGPPVIRERLARMEERQISTERVLNRMETKLDAALAAD